MKSIKQFFNIILNLFMKAPILILLVDIGWKGIINSIPKWGFYLIYIFGPLYAILLIQLVVPSTDQIKFSEVLTSTELIPLAVSFLAPSFYWYISDKPYKTRFNSGLARRFNNLVYLIILFGTPLVFAGIFFVLKISKQPTIQTAYLWYALGLCILLWCIATAYDDYVDDPEKLLQKVNQSERSAVTNIQDTLPDEVN